MKDLFCRLICDPKLNSPFQQDASEALSRILNALQDQEPNQNIYTTGFWFCRYTYRYRYTCNLCGQIDFSQSLPENILRVPVPQRQDVSLTFDMKVAVRSTLEDEHELDNVRTYNQCNRMSVNEKLDIIDTKKFLIVQLLLFDNQQQKLPDMCTPLQNLEVNVCDV